MKARKKAGVIEVHQYLQGAVQGWPPFVRWLEGEPTAVWNEPQQSWVGVNHGDYIRIDNPEDVYPINAEYFAQNFELVPEA